MGIECNTFGFLSIVYHIVCFVCLFVSILAARLCAGFVAQLYLHLPARLFGRLVCLVYFTFLASDLCATVVPKIIFW